MNKLPRLSILAKIPYDILYLEFGKASGEKKKKIQRAINLKTMRCLSNNQNGMFGMRDR